MTKKLVVLAILIGAVLGAARLRSHPPDTHLSGAYRFADGRVVGVSPTLDEQGTWRVREFSTGTVHTLHPEDKGEDRFTARPGWDAEAEADGTVRFEADTLVWSRGSGEIRAERIPLPERTARFPAGDIQLYGKLVLPQGPGPYPAVVLVHGSEKDAATVVSHEGWLLAPHGIAVLMFDKRGTGQSEGKFGMDFTQLAGDVAAAVDWLRQQPEIDPERIGLAGYSQGGWVAPLAASKSKAVKFVLVGYGMVDPPAEEDRKEMLQLLRDKGFGPAEAAKADAMARAAGEVIRSGFEDGWERVDELKQQYKGEPWIDVLGDYTAGSLMRYPGWVLRIAGPRMMPRGLDRHWFYDSRPLLERTDIPMLWLLGGDDVEAPNEVTIAFLKHLEAEGKPVRSILYPGADHGIIVFRKDGQGERVYTGYAPTYYRDKVSWIRERCGLTAPRS
jgi:dienelactone hydrolase